MRTSSNDFDVYTLWPDLNNTAAWQVQNTNGAVTTQRTTPYGAPRDMATRFASDCGFVQGLNDPALGMIRIGARDYDPATGRFLQPDPILDASSSSTQWNAYGYGNKQPHRSTRPDRTPPRRHGRADVHQIPPGIQRQQEEGLQPYTITNARKQCRLQNTLLAGRWCQLQARLWNQGVPLPGG
ncbi:RHS repeat-associated core domain-containing protein [Enemella evansiae]|uniref:RHS repeat-associated core domain-containing protein n=1 Tax=Enemella evansiae TaxID=2016499 RepID=UPI000B96073C|nr:RHS repeat-associated core domain-containing protein [Enemella evansiae]OYO14205.1 hypothetical protein BI335_13530 [Enemella evansiae]